MHVFQRKAGMYTFEGAEVRVKTEVWLNVCDKLCTETSLWQENLELIAARSVTDRAATNDEKIKGCALIFTVLASQFGNLLVDSNSRLRE